MSDRVLLLGVLALVCTLTACGGDDGGGGGDQALVDLLEDEGHQPAAIAECIADELGDEDGIDREELESIVRGEGSTDLDTADAYGDAALRCAREAAGDLPLPDDLSDLLSS